MDTYTLQQDVKTFGFEVKSFPDGIGAAFETLVKLFPQDEKRSYYGLVEGQDGKMKYYALAEEKSDAEPKKFDYPEKVIHKGNYLVEKVDDWQNKTDSIKNVFDKMFKDPRAAIGKPCIEWYKTMNEMWCMVPSKS